MKEKRNMGDISLCGGVADCFAVIGEECNEVDKKYNSQSILFTRDAYWAIPAIINISFACELYLKQLSLIYNREKGGALRTHDLAELFDDLPKGIQAQAEDLFAKKIPYKITLRQTLLIHASSFEAWRYVYEPQNQGSEAYIENLLVATKIFQNILNKNRVNEK